MNFKTNNPIFSNLEQGEVETRATFKGITSKTAILLMTAIISALLVFAFDLENSIFLFPALLISSIVGVVAIIMGRSNPTRAAGCAFVYATCEGIFLGVLSTLFNTIYPGSVVVAVLATFSIFIVMLILYSTKIVQATPMLYKVMMAAGAALFLLYISMFIFSIFGFISDITDPIYAVLSILLIAYGSFMLVLNFEEAKSYVENGLDKKYEWVASLGLIVTIIYIYVQVLRFVAIIMSRNN